ncbi:MAG: hypothetical protein ACRC2V_09615 [Xenococcaceae cyanobacterium]
MSEFFFEKSSQRYKWADTKRYVSTEAVNNLREKAIAMTITEARSLTENMLLGDITVEVWEREFMSQIKTRTIQLYQLGKPGELDQTDKGKLGNQVRYQYDKLWNFRNSIINGELTEAQIKYRSELYFHKTRWAHEEGKRRSHYQAGYMWERRIRQAKESCVECIAIASLSWQAINTLSRIGENCSCKANCKCVFEYSNSITMPEDTHDVLNQIELSWIIQESKK